MNNYKNFSLIPSSIIDDNLFTDRIDRIDRIFSKITGNNSSISNNPNYNFIQKKENIYELNISLPGYKKEDLDISLNNNKLFIKGKILNKTKNNENEKIIYQGFSMENFSLSFNLDNKVEINQANLMNGILSLQLEYKIPENEKYKKININSCSENKNKIK